MVMKECYDILLPSITKLVNCSLSEGFAPEIFKKAVVAQLNKKVSLPHDQMKNYCPVSGLCFIYKLVGRFVASHMIDHIYSNGLDNKHQSAHKVCDSIETALLFIEKRSNFLIKTLVLD